MDLRVHVQRILFILLFITLFTGIGAADTVFVDNFADLKTNLSSGGEKTIVLTKDIKAETSVFVSGTVILTTEENVNCEISFATASSVESGFINVEKGSVITITGNKSGTLTLSGRTSPSASLISVQSAELRMINTILKDNHVTGTDSVGGAISINGGKLYLERTTIKGCSAAYGGAVYLTSGEKSSVDGYFTSVAITDCAAYAGGGIYSGYSGEIPEAGIPKNPHTKLVIFASNIGECSAEDDGGGIYAVASDIVLTNVNIVNSMKYGYSSSIRADSSTITLSSTQGPLDEICLYKSVILLEDKFSTDDNIGVRLISETAVSPYIMKTDSGNIRDVIDYFTVILPQGFLDESDGKTLTLNAYVNFDANGGFGYPFLADLPCAVPVELPLCPYTREGYTFAGWATTPNGAVQYANVGIITLFEPVTLYAVWEKETEIPAYIKTVANGGYVEVSGETSLRYINLPPGASGDLYLYSPDGELLPEDCEVFSVFGLSITEYPVGESSEIGFTLTDTVLSAVNAEDVCLYQFIGGGWEILPTTYEEEGDSIIFEAVTDTLGIFAVVFEDSSVPESPFGMLGVLAGFGAVCLLRRK